MKLLRRALVVSAAASIGLPGLLHPSPVMAAGSSTGFFGFASSGQVVSVDPSTGNVVQLANLFSPTAAGFPTTLAADPATHRLFFGRSLFVDQSVFPPVTAEEIVTIDAANGGITAESPLLAHAVGPIMFDTNSGTLLGVTTDSSPNALVQIDASTGAETNLAAIPGDGFSPFAVAPALHTAYLISESFATFPNTSQLYTIDTTAHTATGGPVLNPGAHGLAYDTSSNQLFAITFNLTPLSFAKFVRVDPVSGAETQLGTYDFGFFLEPGIALDPSSHTVFVTQDVFDDPIFGPITHIASINDSTGAGILGPSTHNTIGNLIFIAPSITADSIISDVKTALASGAIDNAGVANSLLQKLRHAAAARSGGDCKGAANDYQAFINEVSAQSGKHIAASTAGQLTSEAQFLIANCP